MDSGKVNEFIPFIEGWILNYFVQKVIEYHAELFALRNFFVFKVIPVHGKIPEGHGTLFFNFSL